ncbi:MAG: hypothetical protein CMF04_09245 [Hyphomonas sp.]|nr:hypothetical protein [Hyphomonas sp.]
MGGTKLCAAFVLGTTMLGATVAIAQPTGEEPRWIRRPAIAPDGETLAFTYRGQIFMVDAAGGLAVPVTGQDAYSSGAVWSPDSERIAFASDINGDDDVFVTDFTGTLERMSWSSSPEYPTSFTPDGQSVLYMALKLGDAEQSVQGALSGQPQLYAVDTQTGRERLVLPNLARQASWNPHQTKLVYAYDPSGDPSDRQHRVEANARRLWIYDAIGGRHEAVFEADGIDRLAPVWSDDGESLYYLSEASGWLNVWRSDVDGANEVQLTDFAGAPVRDLSVADDGTIAFGWGGRIYVMGPNDETPQAIEILTLEQRHDGPANFRASPPTEFVAAPDGELFALVVNADIYVMNRAGDYRQVTSTPGEERNVAFSPDGQSLIYAGQRPHEWGLYGIDLARDGAADGLALEFDEVAVLVPEEGNALQPQFSPDGSKIAYIADRREVKVLDPDSGDVTTLFGAEDYNTSYIDGDLWFAWSPTSQDLLVQWRTISGGGVSAAAIVPADGRAPPQPVSLGVTSFSDGFWSLDGTQVISTTDLYGMRSAQLHSMTSDLYRIFLSEEARLDFLDIQDGNFPQIEADDDDLTGFTPVRYALDTSRPTRLEGRLTQNHMYPLLVAPLPDFRNLLLVTPEGGDNYGVSTIDMASGATQLIQMVEATDLVGVSYSAELGVIDFVLADAVMSVTPGESEPTGWTPYRIYYASSAGAVREAAFEQAWADLKYRYYQRALEGRDWDAIGAEYRSYLNSIASNRELGELISAMYGELSASHLFVGFSPAQQPGIGLGTYDDVLGVYLDHGYDGPGRRVADLLPGGPLWRNDAGLGPGDVITTVNGRPVPEAGGLERLLDVNLGKPVLLGFTDGESGTELTTQVQPIGRGEQSALASARLIDARRDRVERLSRNCLVYVHLPEMNNDVYLDVIGRLTAARHTAKGALIDVRSNGGGNLTRELITLLTGEAYGQMGLEGRPMTQEPNNRWLLPSAVVVDSYGYSDGSVFPQAYHDLKIGPIVGDVVLNTGTAVNYINSKLVPGLQYGIPELPYRRLDGSYYENNVVLPDIAVPFDPNQAGLNVDPQLDAAIEALMSEVGRESDCGRPGS